MMGDGPWPRYPVYLFGGRVSEVLYSPIVRLDQQLFPRRWVCTRTDLDEMFGVSTK